MATTTTSNDTTELERLRQNEPHHIHSDLSLRADATDSSLEDLAEILQHNTTLQSVNLRYYAPCRRRQNNNHNENTHQQERRSSSNDASDCNSSKNHTASTTRSSNSNTNRNQQILLVLNVVQALGNIPSLRIISIAGSNVVNNGNYCLPVTILSTLFRSARFCKRLSLGRVKFIGANFEEFRECARVLKQHPALQDIYLNACANGNLVFGGGERQKILLQGLAAIPTLKSLTLNGTGFSSLVSGARHTSSDLEQSLRLLCQSTSLQRLLIYDIPLMDGHLEVIAQQLLLRSNGANNSKEQPGQQRRNNQQHIKEIRLSSCTLGDRGMEALTNIVSSSSSSSSLLRVLHVWIGHFDLLDGEGSYDEEQASKTSRLLCLATALKGSMIRDFRLSAGTRSQQELRATKHPISGHQVQSAFVHPLHHSSYQLETCSILCTPPDLQAEASFYLKLNQLGRRRLFGHRGRGQKVDWVDVLSRAAAAGDLKSIYYFLSVNPSLCHATTG